MQAQDLRAIVEQAARAPSIHNTQPWRFVVGTDTIELWTDPSRGLDVLDPTGRERHVSCGAALLHARVAAAAAGYRTEVNVLPTPDDVLHLADLRLTPGEPAPADAELASALALRHTDRGVFSGEEVPAEIVEELRRAVEAEGCWLRVIDDRNDATAVAVLLARADEVEAADPAYREELRRWTSKRDAAEGVPDSAVPDTDPRRRGSNYRLRDFVADREADVGPADEPPAVERPLVAVLGGPDDDIAAWLAAGQALGRLLLVATLRQVSASPMTQVLEIPDTRALLATDLRLVGHPQMLLRLGYGSGGTATPRRPVEDIVAERE